MVGGWGFEIGAGSPGEASGADFIAHKRLFVNQTELWLILQSPRRRSECASIFLSSFSLMTCKKPRHFKLSERASVDLDRSTATLKATAYVLDLNEGGLTQI